MNWLDIVYSTSEAEYHKSQIKERERYSKSFWELQDEPWFEHKKDKKPTDDA